MTAKADTEIQTRQLIMTMDAIAKKSTTAQAEAELKKAESVGETEIAKAEGNLGTVKTHAAQEEQAAQNALSRAQEYWAAQEAAAQKAIALAEGESKVALANAQQNLQTIESTAAKEEARLEKAAAVEKEKAQTQYAGSGLTIQMYGMNPEDAAANASELGWILRSQLPS